MSKVNIKDAPRLLKSLDIPVVFINGIFGTPKDMLKTKLKEMEYNIQELKKPDPKNAERINLWIHNNPHSSFAIFADFRDYEDVKAAFHGIDRYSYLYIHPSVQTKYKDVLSSINIPVLTYTEDIEKLTLSMQSTNQMERDKKLRELTIELYKKDMADLKKHQEESDERMMIIIS